MPGEIEITHEKISAVPSDGDTTYIQGPDWNAQHVVIIHPVALTAALNAFTTVLQGEVPASGGADGYLKGDGSWSSAATLTAALAAFTSSLKGEVPASGGGIANFLRADVAWAPAGLLGIQVLAAASGTYDPTAGTTRAIVFQQAAGGGGGGANSTTGVAAAGGGSSGVLQVCLVGTPGTPLGGGAYVNGAGGAGGPTGGSSGLLGGDASLDVGGTTLVAAGGGPGFGCINVAAGSFNIAPSSSPTASTTPGAALQLWKSVSLGARGEVLSTVAWESGMGGSTLIATGGGDVGGTNPGNNGIRGGGGSGAASSAGGGVGQVGGNGGDAIQIVIEFA